MSHEGGDDQERHKGRGRSTRRYGTDPTAETAASAAGPTTEPLSVEELTSDTGRHERVGSDTLKPPLDDGLTSPEIVLPEASAPPPQRRGGGALRPDGVEVDIVHEAPGRPESGRWRAFEVWTKKSVYAIDAHLQCIAVIDRATGAADARHRFVGASLMGGEHKNAGKRSFSYPLPVPGGDAVFQLGTAQSGIFGHTSTVERVLMRLRVTQVEVEDTDAFWAALGREQDASGKK